MSNGRRWRSDLDRHRQQTYSRLVWGGFAILLLVGGGLVWLFYGFSAAFTVIACLLMVIMLFGLLWLVLSLLELWVRDDEP
jgi:hypothetical protein